MASKTILAATDLRDASDEAVRQAHDWAQRRQARLVVCHVAPRVVGSEVLFPQAIAKEAFDQATLELRAGELLRRRTCEATGRRPAELEAVVVAGSASTEIVRLAEERRADLVVVGSHGHSALTRIFLGDVADRVVRDARCPVLVARAHAPTRRIVVGTDFSKPSAYAVHLAAEEARLRPARLTLVASIGRYMDDVRWMAEFGAIGDFVEHAYQEERKKVERQLRELVQREGVDADIEVTDIGAAAAIVQAASRLDADLVVVGAVGAGVIERLALGRVAAKVVRHAPASVLVARQRPER